MCAKRIGLFVSDLTDNYQKEILHGIRDAASDNNLSLCIFEGGQINKPWPTRHNRDYVYSYAKSMNLDAILAFSGSISISCGFDAFLDFANYFAPTPFFSIGVELPEYNSIIIENKSGITELTRHLIVDHGCKNIAFIKGPEENKEAIERFNAFISVLDEFNLPLNRDFVYEGNFELYDGSEAVKEFLDQRKIKFDAIISSDDSAALSAMRELQSRGFKIPDDIKITGFDDIQSSRFANPPLTTIRQNLYELGRIALNSIDKKELRPFVKVPTTTVLRASCGCSYPGLPYHYLMKERVQKEANLQNYNPEARTMRFKKISNEENFTKITIIGDEMMTCFSLEALKKHLDRIAVSFSLDECIITLNGDNETTVFYSKCNKMEEGKTVKEGLLLPLGMKLPDSQICSIHPLTSFNEHMGNVIFCSREINVFAFSSIAIKISHTLRTARLMEKLHVQTEELEQEVEKRTRELKAAYEKVKELSLVDQLSGLKNRRFLDEVIMPQANLLMNTILQKGQNKKNRKKSKIEKIGLILLDMDYFKSINDNYGHDAGDRVIAKIGEILNQNMRKNDFAIRWGGEEFLLVLNDFNPKFLLKKAETFRELISNTDFPITQNRTLRITCSIGCNVYPPNLAKGDFVDLKAVLSLTDFALYSAKNIGRNHTSMLTINPKLALSLEKVQAILREPDLYLKNRSMKILLKGGNRI